MGTAGDELVLAVKPDASARYQWFQGDTAVAGATSSLVVKVAADEAIYRVVAENSCGKGESRTRVKALTVRAGE